MERSSTQVDDQSTGEPIAAPAPPDPTVGQPIIELSTEPVNDWDLRALDVTAGEPD